MTLKKIGIIGLGSIGRRHARMLKQLGVDEIRALRTKKGVLKAKPDEFIELQEFTDEKEFYSGLDGVIISNPTSLHVETALTAAQKGLPVFIEKPISDTIAKAKPLEKYQSQIIVGYCFRFSGFVNFIKQFIASGNIGRVYKATFVRSYYLPKWHPYADYRKEYTARKDLGGGVLRTLSHEIDLMLYLFGYPISTIGYTDKVSDLEIDTDDLAFFSCKMKGGARVNFELDFLSPDYVNKGTIIGQKGKLEYDMDQIQFIPMEGESTVVYEFKKNEIDEMYLNQMKDFIRFINTENSQNCNYEDAIETMRIIDELDKI